MAMMTWLILGAALAAGAVAAEAERIDRRALVTRHNPRIKNVDTWAPLTVGNGQFCFTADVTGLQTFYAHYQKNGIGLETQARWAWHSNPNPHGYTLADANRPFTAYGTTIGYPTEQGSAAGRWLRENPHTRPLPQIALEVVRPGGAALQPEELSGIEQTLDLWSGTLTSRYAIDGVPVKVVTASAGGAGAGELLAVRIESALVGQQKLAVRFAMPRGYDIKTKNNPALDWSEPESHTTELIARDASGVVFFNRRDDAGYVGKIAGAVAVTKTGAHALRVTGRSGDVLEFVVEFDRGFSATGAGSVMTAERVRAESERRWAAYWRSGAAVDFSGSTDPRARELERRVVLSQYLMAVQMAGDFPPQETGLTLSSWYGKHHTEMIWWHAAHFALWGRDEFLEKNLRWYVGALPIARELARSRGLNGARWAKMIGPDGRESPGGNPLIVWNQPHPIHLAELLYRNAPTKQTLERYRELVLETAEGVASMLNWEEAGQRYNLGPPLWIAQEIYDPAASMNPTYELSYWIRGLKIAQEWRERLGLPRDKTWDERVARIAKLPVKDGKYVAIETVPDTWENKASRHDHPSFLMALGQLPGDGVDVATMRRTLEAVLESWDWETKIWGWDYPMVAMTAARLGEPKKALDVLLFTKGPNNAYKPNGHCPQRGDLPVYLPANGALLAAVAMMAGGWDGAPAGEAPGFPKDGTWVVRSEGLRRLP